MDMPRVTTAPSGVTSNFAPMKILTTKKPMGEGTAPGRARPGESVSHSNPPPESFGSQVTLSLSIVVGPKSIPSISPESCHLKCIVPLVCVARRATCKSAPCRTLSSFQASLVVRSPVHVAFALTVRSVSTIGTGRIGSTITSGASSLKPPRLASLLCTEMVCVLLAGAADADPVATIAATSARQSAKTACVLRPPRRRLNPVFISLLPSSSC